MIELFDHNQIAYNALSAMLDKTSRAAIVHPTGTGKSFIAFRLVQDHPHQKFCWLSPSEYIFQTQLQNVKRISGFSPDNIRFLTYAKLCQMTKEDIGSLQPDYIILDEFHRCGAEEWGKGVQMLLAASASARIAGFTATSVRYLDNQRNMADELFDGNVAHHMTLGEAIVRGCLPAPKYIVALYACDVEKYARRFRKAGAAVRQAAAVYMDRLRRMAETADGLNAIFEKHLPRKDGKYILFCSDREHMRAIRGRLHEWFAGIDEKPHVYEVYAQSPNAREAFAAFKADQSAHIKLLLCIDMLNEGIHVEDLSGVILFRPTVSPIVYKQQIGRALSAVKGHTPVIFDLVNNVENLYSISAVRQEMDEIISFLSNQNRTDEILQNGFELIDEVRDWRELFDQLEETLSAPWELMYQKAADYYACNGHLNVPRRYLTQDGAGLGNWIHTQRSIRRGVCAGKLDDRRIALLDQIGMIWESTHDLAWEEGYAHALAYYHQHGDLDVPGRYTSPDGYALGGWVSNMRAMYSGIRSRTRLTDERISRLEAIGMIWNRLDYGFEQGALAAARYAVQHGHLNVPSKYVDETGFKLGSWLNAVRRKRDSLTEEQVNRLEKMGFQWECSNRARWEKAYAVAELFFRENGCLKPPSDYERDGVRLARWLYHQQERYARGTLAVEDKQRLEAIGMDWNSSNAWEDHFRQAKAFYVHHGHLQVPARVVTADGMWLNKWLAAQRKAYSDGKLTRQQIDRLESIGMKWEPMKTVQWNRMYDALMSYCEKGGSIAALPQDYKSEHGDNLFNWLKKQKHKQKHGLLEEWQLIKLRTLTEQSQV